MKLGPNNQAHRGEHGSMTRQEVDELLWNKLPDWMTDAQRKTKVGNLLGELKRANRITNVSTKKTPSWILVK